MLFLAPDSSHLAKQTSKPYLRMKFRHGTEDAAAAYSVCLHMLHAVPLTDFLWATEMSLVINIMVGGSNQANMKLQTLQDSLKKKIPPKPQDT